MQFLCVNTKQYKKTKQQNKYNLMNMRSIKIKLLAIILISTIGFSSCVSSKKYKELLGKRDTTEQENSKLKDDNRNLRTSNNEKSSLIAKHEKQIKNLQDDTTNLGRNYRSMQNRYGSLNKNYQDLLEQNKNLIKGNQRETKKILTQLQKSQADLIKREDSLSVLESEYNKRKGELDILSEQLAAMQESLYQKELAYNALNDEVKRKDSAMMALRNSVANALVGYENQGLTVTTRNGRVYVSMDNKLMFASGSFNVNVNGKVALEKLADVLKDNKDINILVEGHTDSIPYRGSGKISDNWDLSAKRATSIVRILTANNKIASNKITAAGRGEFNPIASNATKEGRAKNRRTEIILMPDLSNLYNMVVDGANAEDEVQDIESTPSTEVDDSNNPK